MSVNTQIGEKSFWKMLDQPAGKIDCKKQIIQAFTKFKTTQVNGEKAVNAKIETLFKEFTCFSDNQNEVESFLRSKLQQRRTCAAFVQSVIDYKGPAQPLEKAAVTAESVIVPPTNNETPSMVPPTSFSFQNSPPPMGGLTPRPAPTYSSEKIDETIKDVEDWLNSPPVTNQASVKSQLESLTPENKTVMAYNAARFELRETITKFLKSLDSISHHLKANNLQIQLDFHNSLIGELRNNITLLSQNKAIVVDQANSPLLNDYNKDLFDKKINLNLTPLIQGLILANLKYEKLRKEPAIQAKYPESKPADQTKTPVNPPVNKPTNNADNKTKTKSSAKKKNFRTWCARFWQSIKNFFQKLFGMKKSKKA